MTKHYLLLCFCLFSVVLLNAQGGTTCATAAPMTVQSFDAPCTQFNGPPAYESTFAVGNSTYLPPAEYVCFSTVVDTVEGYEQYWKFTPTEPFTRVKFIGILNTQFQIFEGDCGNQTQLLCTNDELTNGNAHTFIVPTNPGTETFVRAFLPADLIGSGQTYSICPSSPGPVLYAEAECVDGFSMEVDVTAYGLPGIVLDGSGDPLIGPYDVVDDQGSLILDDLNLGGTATDVLYENDLMAQFTLFEDNNVQSPNLSPLFTSVSIVCGPTNANGLSPLNDECTGAFALPLGDGVCGSQRGTVMLNGTKSMAPLTPPCDNFYAGAVNDSWFTVTNTFSTVKDITVTQSGTNTSYQVALFTGPDCGNLVLLPGSCTTGTDQSVTATNVPPGATIYALLMTNLNIPTADLNFVNYLCATATDPATPPANDEPSAALPLLFNSDATCNQTITGTTANATDSNVPDSDEHDVWFSINVPASGNLNLEVADLLEATALGVSVYESDLFGITNLIGSFDGSPTGTSVQLVDLNPGPLLVSVYPDPALFNPGIDFTVCARDQPALLSVDGCTDSGPNALLVQPYDNCTGVFATTVGTGSEMAHCNPFANSIPRDVWFRFVATNPTMQLNVSNARRVNSASNLGVGVTTEVFSGTCGSLSQVVCSSANTTLLQGLTVGDQYLVRAYESNGSEINFEFCLTLGGPPPANDDCSNATVVVPASNYAAATPVAGTTEFVNDPLFFQGVWYRIEPGYTDLTVLVEQVQPPGGGPLLPLSDLKLAYYDEDACSLFLPATPSSNGRLVLTDLDPNSAHYIQVYDERPDGRGVQFELRVFLPTSGSTCSQGIPLWLNAENDCTTTIPGDFRNAGSPAGTINFCGTNDLGVWYQFDPNGPNETIEVPTSNQTTTLVAFQGSCSGIPLACAAPGDPLELTNLSHSFPALPADRVYIAVLTEFPATNATQQPSTFEVCRRTPPPPPANDEPAGAVVLTYSDLCTAAVEGTIEAATQTKAPDCNDANFFGQNAKDVWYQFTAPSSSVNINVVPKSFASFAVELFAGTNLNGASLDCALDAMFNGETTLTATVTQGLTYYVRVYDAQDFGFDGPTGDDAKFSICLSGLPTVQLPFATGQCENAASTINSTGSGVWKYFTDANGRLICGILDSENLGVVSGSFYAGFQNAPRQNGTGVEVMNRNFGITPQKQPNNPVHVRLFVSEGDYQNFIQNQDGDNNDADDLTDLVVYRYTGQACLTMPPMGGTLHTPIASGQISNTGYYVEIQIPSFSAFFLSGNGAVLPVDWKSFGAQRTEPRRVDLNWTTATEWNSDRFVVERSADGTRFEEVGVQPAAGISQTETHYRFTDHHAPATDQYYRLRQVDYDGQYSYSELRFVPGTDERLPVEILPNPTFDFVTVKNLVPGTALRVYNGYGDLLQTLPRTDVDQNVYLLDGFPAGVYLLQIHEPNRRPRTERLLKVR